MGSCRWTRNVCVSHVDKQEYVGGLYRQARIMYMGHVDRQCVCGPCRWVESMCLLCS